jgi:transmembrane sensor
VDRISKWKNGVLLLDGENFSEFKEKIERWFGISVKVDGRVPGGWSIKGQFENESLENVLMSISFNKKFEYVIKEKVLTIKF